MPPPPFRAGSRWTAIIPSSATARATSTPMMRGSRLGDVLGVVTSANRSSLGQLPSATVTQRGRDTSTPARGGRRTVVDELAGLPRRRTLGRDEQADHQGACTVGPAQHGGG